MLSAVIFDMDGVLIDSHPAHKLAWRALLREIGRDCSDSDLEFVLDGRTRQDILRHFLGEITDDELQAYSKLKEKQFAAYGDRVRLVPGVPEFLAALTRAGLRSAVASSASPARVGEMLRRFGIADSFRAIVTGDDVRHGKPDPAIFTLATENLAVAPESVVVFEDAISGVRGAIAAGLKCVGIGSGEHAQKLLKAGATAVRPDFVGLAVPALQTLLQQSS